MAKIDDHPIAAHGKGLKKEKYKTELIDPVIESARSSRTSCRVKPVRVQRDPKFSMSTGAFCFSHSFQRPLVCCEPFPAPPPPLTFVPVLATTLEDDPPPPAFAVAFMPDCDADALGGKGCSGLGTMAVGGFGSLGIIETASFVFSRKAAASCLCPLGKNPRLIPVGRRRYLGPVERDRASVIPARLTATVLGMDKDMIDDTRREK
mmetsp:Transcript_53025/g.158695  ORF Transcript_53025/g.158695 Transcript_53025/m.158695 type:complete len:206 (-) Transcript_53025:89-706(-)